ncbi:MAG: hypothetical protein M3464_15800 [Chloroflexota bacterium]|nr:hypothetical protein [Chloroflexota bacterium]
MANIDFVNDLADDETDWQRVRIRTNRGRVTDFTVQYETTVDGNRLAVIRYDSAHGFPHVDVMNRRGELVEKTPMPDNPPLNEALQFAVGDIKRNWPVYRRRFFEEGT